MRPVICDCGTAFSGSPSDMDCLAMVVHWRKGHVLRLDLEGLSPADAMWHRGVIAQRLHRWRDQQIAQGASA